MSIPGLHHVTAIAGDAQRNHDFYTEVLGLRLVKKTVNFDDPGTYHLYFGNEAGEPGTILTFFPWANAAPGRFGAGETGETAFRVPEDALEFWQDRLAKAGVSVDPRVRRFGAEVLPFADPHGTRLALVAAAGAEREPAWEGAGIGGEAAIRGFHGVTLLLEQTVPTAQIITDVFGFAQIGEEEGVVRLAAPGTALGGIVDLKPASGAGRGRLGAGTVHHIAFRAADDAAQETMVQMLRDRFGIATTEQRDRNYFRSVYFREPGGVLFEIATDVPGFAVDEPAAHLGEALKLPRGLEPRRAQLEAVLPALAGQG